MKNSRRVGLISIIILVVLLMSSLAEAKAYKYFYEENDDIQNWKTATLTKADLGSFREYDMAPYGYGYGNETIPEKV